MCVCARGRRVLGDSAGQRRRRYATLDVGCEAKALQKMKVCWRGFLSTSVWRGSGGLARLSCETANFISAGVSAAGEPSSSGRM